MGSDPFLWCRIVAAWGGVVQPRRLALDCNNAGAGYPAPASCRQAGRRDRHMVSASAAASAGITATTATAPAGITAAASAAGLARVTAATVGRVSGLNFVGTGNATATAATGITTTTSCWHFKVSPYLQTPYAPAVCANIVKMTDIANIVQ
jgi:hypothetical protein